MELALATALLAGITGYNRSLSRKQMKTDVHVNVHSGLPPAIAQTSTPRASGAQRMTGQVNKLYRQNGELRSAETNVANSPYINSAYKVDPVLEAVTRGLTAAVDPSELKAR